MPCYNPLTGYRGKHANDKTGRKPIVWKEESSDGTGAISLPCGKCTGCRLEYSRSWALRCYHESKMHDENSFLTLTYDPEHLPPDFSIHKEELQDFFKKLRYELNEIYGRTYTHTDSQNRRRYEPNKPVRYFACGEYGESAGRRPHYHALIFGFDFPDKYLYSMRDGIPLYRSPFLEKVWTKGFSTIGQVTFESAAYVARYVMKKRKGPPGQTDKHGKTNEQYYEAVDPETGEIHQTQPEFCLMSRRPGIGKKWYDAYKGDLNKDFLTLANGRHKIPRYYDTLSEEEDETAFLLRKEKRAEKIKYEEGTIARLRVREKVKIAQVNQLKRGYENET